MLAAVMVKTQDNLLSMGGSMINYSALIWFQIIGTHASFITTLPLQCVALVVLELLL